MNEKMEAIIRAEDNARDIQGKIEGFLESDDSAKERAEAG